MDTKHVVLFGGYQPGLGCNVNDVFILDLARMVSVFVYIESGNFNSYYYVYHYTCIIIYYGHNELG